MCVAILVLLLSGENDKNLGKHAHLVGNEHFMLWLKTLVFRSEVSLKRAVDRVWTECDRVKER